MNLGFLHREGVIIPQAITLFTVDEITYKNLIQVLVSKEDILLNDFPT